MPRSGKNTATESRPSETANSLLQGDDLGADGAKKDQAKADLEKELNTERDQRKEERFVWIVICVILVDILIFRNSENAILPIVVLVLQLVLLLILAKRLGIEEIATLIDRVIHSIGRGGPA